MYQSMVDQHLDSHGMVKSDVAQKIESFYLKLMDNFSFVAHLFNVKNMFTSNHPQNKR